MHKYPVIQKTDFENLQQQANATDAALTTVQDQVGNSYWRNYSLNRSTTTELFEDDFIKIRWNTSNEQFEFLMKSTAPIDWESWMDRIAIKVDGSSTTARFGGDDLFVGEDVWHQLAVDTTNHAAENWGAGGIFLLQKEDFVADFPSYHGMWTYGGSNVDLALKINYKQPL